MIHRKNLGFPQQVPLLELAMRESTELAQNSGVLKAWDSVDSVDSWHQHERVTQTKIASLEEVPPMINIAICWYKYEDSIFRSEGSKSVLSGFFRNECSQHITKKLVNSKGNDPSWRKPPTRENQTGLGMNVVETSDICFIPGCFETLQLKHLEDRTDETKQDDLNRFQQQEVATIK